MTNNAIKCCKEYVSSKEATPLYVTGMWENKTSAQKKIKDVCELLVAREDEFSQFNVEPVKCGGVF